MSDRIVCSQCAVISRGFTGHCKHVVDLVEAMRERCAKVVEDDPELPGPMPPEIRKAFEKADLEDVARFVVRSTKKCLAKKIRAGE